jgi:hypothetical protein
MSSTKRPPNSRFWCAHRIHAHASSGEIANDRINKARGDRHGRREPAMMGNRSVTGDARGGANRQAADGDDHQRPQQQPIKVDRHLHRHKDRRCPEEFLSEINPGPLARRLRRSRADPQYIKRKAPGA